jgi:putative ABC transport system permease protein
VSLHSTIRTLRRQPGFAALTVLILALGIGATTAMFSVLNELVLRPLPHPDADRLVRIHRTQGAQQEWPHSAPNFGDLRAQSTAFDGMAAWNPRRFGLVLPEQPALSLDGLEVSADFFRVLRARPVHGRFFVSEEDAPAANAVVVLATSLWHAHFASDPRVVGRRLRIDGEVVTVVGIAPPELSSPRLWGAVQIWRPLGVSPAMAQARRHNWLQVMARLAPEVTPDEAQAQLSVLWARLDRDSGGTGIDSGLRVYPLQTSALDDTSRRIVWLSMALSGLVLLIACTNLAGLTLARHAARARDQAIRAALGASAGRLWRETVGESLLLALVGGALGILVARWTADLIGQSIDLGNGGVGLEVPLDLSVLVLALVLAAITALLVGSAPALLVPPRQLQSGARLGAGRGTDASRPRLRQALVAGQVALSLVLLAASVLFLRGLDRLVKRDPGWKVDGLVTARLNLPSAAYRTDAERRQFLARLDARLATIPGVEASGLAWWLPLESAELTSYLAVEGQPQLLERGHHVRRASNDVTPGYFAAVGLRLVQGRAFTASDGPDAEPVVIINQSLARRFWPDGSALGKRIAKMGDRGWTTVVGVVDDVRYPAKLSRMVTRLQIYRPLAQQPKDRVVIHLRSGLPPDSQVAALGPALRAAVAELDPDLPVQEIATAREALGLALHNVALIGRVLLGLAALGLLLVAVGVYGLFSRMVVQRTREIGVRVALGADSAQVLRLVLGKALALAALGAAVGLPVALGVAPLLAALAPELPASEPTAVALLAALLVAVALLACWLPARRAAAVDPMVALRQD